MIYEKLLLNEMKFGNVKKSHPSENQSWRVSLSLNAHVPQRPSAKCVLRYQSAGVASTRLAAYNAS
jgi:hypothetical protein